MKYVALLRGINVGGNNRVSMADLKTCLEKEGLGNIVTYINSGNVIFEYPEIETSNLVKNAKRHLSANLDFI